MELDQKVRQKELDRLMRIKSVLEIVPVSKSTWWAWVASGKAPAPIRLGRTTCWRSTDIARFIAEVGGAK